MKTLLMENLAILHSLIQDGFENILNLKILCIINRTAEYNASAKDYGLINSQHPVASVLEGERLIKNVYEAVRNGPQWN